MIKASKAIFHGVFLKNYQQTNPRKFFCAVLQKNIQKTAFKSAPITLILITLSQQNVKFTGKARLINHSDLFQRVAQKYVRVHPTSNDNHRKPNAI